MIYNSVVPYSYKECASAIAGFLSIRDYAAICEEALGAMVGREAVLVDSGLTALLLLLHLHEIGEGAEIAVPAYLCERVGRGLLEAGYSIRFVDVDDNYNISVEDLRSKASSRTKAVVAAHSYGIPCRIAEIMKVAEERSMVVIEDSAQAFGWRENGKALGASGDGGIFSFGWFKPLSAMGGGALVVQDGRLKARAVQMMADDVSFRDRLSKLIKSLCYIYKPFYHASIVNSYGLIKKMSGKRLSAEDRCLECGAPAPGPFARMQNLQASLALEQLKRHEEFNRRRMANAEFLLAALSSAPIRFPPDSGRTPLLRLPVYFETYGRTQVIEISRLLARRGVEAPLLYPYLPEVVGVEAEICGNAKRLADKTLHLPLHPELKEKHLQYIVTTFQQTLRQLDT